MFKHALRQLSVAAITSLGLAAGTASAVQPLTVQVYNPGDKGVFPVSSELIVGKTEAVLVDAQFERQHAQAVADMVKASGKELTTIYISHSDPDFYFGLDVLTAAFPKARVVATPQTVAKIKASMDGKLAYWGPILKDNAPQKLVLPQALAVEQLRVDGQKIEIKGLQSAAPERSYLWIPSLKAVLGGVLLFDQMHVWVADTQTPASRVAWDEALAAIAALKPKTVVPGHYLGERAADLRAVTFTRDYLKAFEREARLAKDSSVLRERMNALYPGLGGGASLDISAKVIEGEMKWPAE